MDDANNHTTLFTAADIEKYHRGMLSSKEMHALEKAALDDPFLADALEGYSVPGVNVDADIAELKKQLAQKTEEEPARVIPIAGSGRSFPWLRAAVLIVGIAGAALLTYQLAFNNKKEDRLAKYEDNTVSGLEKSKQNEASVTPVDSAKQQSVDAFMDFHKQPDSGATQSNSYAHIEIKPLNFSQRETNNVPAGIIGENDYVKRDSPVSKFLYRGDEATTTPAPSKSQRDGRATMTDSLSSMPGSIMPGYDRNANPMQDKTIAGAEKKLIPAADELAKQKVAQSKKRTADDVLAERSVTYNSGTRPTGNIDTHGNSNNGFALQQNKDNNYYKLNSFRGQVLDNNNNPLPFANVTNVQDGIGTYADSKGFFNLTSTADSQLNVNVRVLGYNNLNYQLKSTTGLLNKVLLQEDRSLSAQVVEKNKKANEAARKSRNTMKLAGEPEPEDGWDNYYSYLDNNTNAPEEALRAKENASGLTVDISFEVNKYGEPVDIKIERSLCPQCNDEAIRLIKQGPKWKRKAKKGRTTVTISF